MIHAHVKVAKDMKTLFNKTDNQLLNSTIRYIITDKGSNEGEKAIHPTQYLNLKGTP